MKLKFTQWHHYWYWLIKSTGSEPVWYLSLGHIPNFFVFVFPLSSGSRGEESSEEDPPIDITSVQDMLSSHHYKSFKISMIHKLRFTTDVQLGTFCLQRWCRLIKQANTFTYWTCVIYRGLWLSFTLSLVRAPYVAKVCILWKTGSSFKDFM